MHVNFDEDYVGQWLASPDPMVTGGTFADMLGVDEQWPGTAADEQVSNVILVVEQAIEYNVIAFKGLVGSADLVRTVDRHCVLSGFRVAVDLSTGVVVGGGSMWADDLTGGERGEAGVLAALKGFVGHVEELAAGYAKDIEAAAAGTASKALLAQLEGARAEAERAHRMHDEAADEVDQLKERIRNIKRANRGFTEDEAHVMVDAVNLLRGGIGSGSARPWADYEGGEDDPKLNRDGYLSLLNHARNTLLAIIGEPGDGQAVVTLARLAEILRRETAVIDGDDVDILLDVIRAEVSR